MVVGMRHPSHYPAAPSEATPALAVHEGHTDGTAAMHGRARAAVLDDVQLKRVDVGPCQRERTAGQWSVE